MVTPGEITDEMRELETPELSETNDSSTEPDASAQAQEDKASSGTLTGKNYELSFIGFSNDPEGDEDDTEFYRNESFFVRVHDVDLEDLGTNAGVRLLMYQENIPTVQFNLADQTNGTFKGSIPLRTFQQGRIYISVGGWNPKGILLRKDTEIFINP